MSPETPRLGPASRPCGDECCRERAGREDHSGRGDRRRIGGGDAEQLGLDELAEGGDARERNGHTGGDHDDGVAQDEADGGSACGAKREANADFAGPARDHEGHHSVEPDQRQQQRQHAEAAGEGGQEALGAERAIDLVVEGAEPEDWQPRVILADQMADGRNDLLGSAANLDIVRLRRCRRVRRAGRRPARSYHGDRDSSCRRPRRRSGYWA
jgi:hypothetical protein